jgi:hypothetical protein
MHSWWGECIITLPVTSSHFNLADGCAISFDTNLALLYLLQ